MGDLRESVVTTALDGWSESVFDPENLDATIAAKVTAQGPDDAAAARAEAARRKIVDCDDRLRKYRAVLDGGNPPEVVLSWSREVEVERLVAQRELDGTSETAPLTEDEVRALVHLVKRGLIGAAPYLAPGDHHAGHRGASRRVRECVSEERLAP